MGATVETLKGLIKSPEGRSIGELEHAEYNPRKIGDQALKALGEAMVRFGDLSGIVFNRRTGRLIGGHPVIRRRYVEFADQPGLAP